METYRESNQDARIAVHGDFGESLHLYSYGHDGRADKNPYRHDRNMRYSSKLNYAFFAFSLLVIF